MAFDRLIDNIIEKQNPTVAGLDPKLDYVPASIKDACFAQYGKTLEGAAAALLAFNKAIIDQIYDIVPAVKPQAAYYEMYGWQGVKALAETIAYAKGYVRHYRRQAQRHRHHHGSVCHRAPRHHRCGGREH